MGLGCSGRRLPGPAQNSSGNTSEALASKTARTLLPRPVSRGCCYIRVFLLGVFVSVCACAFAYEFARACTRVRTRTLAPVHV